MIQKNIETNKKMISCSQSELFYLSEKDPILGEAIRKIGTIERTFYPDFYEGFANAIIGQQISTKAMETVWSRLTEVCKIITPQSILDTDYDVLKACGISGRKIDYLIQCARKIQDGTLQVEELNQKSDDEVEKILTSLSGVGKWTAEMLLIFTFGRSNILSFGDFGIRKGICNLYGLDEISLETFTEFKSTYSPYGTVASFYLWEIARRT